MDFDKKLALIITLNTTFANLIGVLSIICETRDSFEDLLDRELLTLQDATKCLGATLNEASMDNLKHLYMDAFDKTKGIVEPATSEEFPDIIGD